MKGATFPALLVMAADQAPSPCELFRAAYSCLPYRSFCPAAMLASIQSRSESLVTAFTTCCIMAPPWPIEHRSFIEPNPHQSPARAFFYWITDWLTFIGAQVELELFLLNGADNLIFVRLALPVMILEREYPRIGAGLLSGIGRDQMTPNSRPTLLKAASPLSRSSRECAAEIITRIRALPRGTVGKPRAIAKMSSAKSRRLKS